MNTPTADTSPRSTPPTMYEDDARRAQIGGAHMGTVALIDFGDVIKGLKQGKCFTRLGWKRAGQFIFRVPGSRFTVNRPPLSEQIAAGTKLEYAAHIDIKTLNGLVSVWSPSQRDLEAEDWFEVVGDFEGGAA